MYAITDTYNVQYVITFSYNNLLEDAQMKLMPNLLANHPRAHFNDFLCFNYVV